MTECRAYHFIIVFRVQTQPAIDRPIVSYVRPLYVLTHPRGYVLTVNTQLMCLRKRLESKCFTIEPLGKCPRLNIARIIDALPCEGRQNRTTQRRTNQRTITRDPHNDISTVRLCSPKEAVQNIVFRPLEDCSIFLRFKFKRLVCTALRHRAHHLIHARNSLAPAQHLPDDGMAIQRQQNLSR